MMNRRDFLTSAALAPLVTAVPFVGPANAAARWDRAVVMVELGGGNDGLNTVVPHTDSRYYSLRPNLAVPRETVLQLDERLGFAPALEPLMPLWDQGQLAVALGVGYPDPNLSHFRGIEIWDTATDSTEFAQSGWIGQLYSAVEAPPPDFAADGMVLGRGVFGPLKAPGRRILVLKNFAKLEDASLGALLMIEDISSEKRMKSTMSRYMDPGIAEQMLAAGEDVMGGTESVCTVLFSDVRSFTTLTEKLGPQGTVSLLNEYFTLMVDCIQAEDGMLDKFIGDAIMAAFGIPVDHGDDEDRAVRAALKMLVDLREWNDKREAKGQMRVEMGVGLNTDFVVSGNIGSPKRMDYTLIRDGVNLAARLESACKQYSAKLLISEFTYAKLKGTYRAREIDCVIVKGKTEPVGVVELLDYHTDDSFPNLMDAVNYFREGITEFRKGNWDKSIGRFKEVLGANPNDALSHTYIERNETMKKKNPKDWNGVWVMTSK